MILKLGKTLSTVFTIDLLHILYIIHVTLLCMVQVSPLDLTWVSLK